ncbi:hypothetical protein F8S13_22390 [Chloroflexia bacterium SDU3-3]|nr:hypothetical protein F8S13_22390 [Chloroflexia bacterium SDU3-3]
MDHEPPATRDADNAMSAADRTIVQTLSNLLAEGERFAHKLAQRRFNPFRTAEERTAFMHRYEDWYARGMSALPADLQPHFEDRFGVLAAIPSDWMTFRSELPLTLQDQLTALRSARRRRWVPETAYPAIHRLIATICRTTYHAEHTLDDLFLDGHWEPGAYLPPFDPSESAMEHRARGWLDGLLFFAPADERRALRAICTLLRTKPGRAQGYRAALDQALQQLSAPTSTPMPAQKRAAPPAAGPIYHFHSPIHAGKINLGGTETIQHEKIIMGSSVGGAAFTEDLAATYAPLRSATQAIGSMAHGSADDRQQLTALVQQLSSTLMAAPVDAQEHAEAIADLTSDLLGKAAKEQPNRTLITISAESLTQAAAAVEDTLPAAPPLVRHIVQVVQNILSPEQGTAITLF